MAETTTNMHLYLGEYGCFSPGSDFDTNRKVDPTPKTWVQFLEQSGWDGQQGLNDIKPKLLV